MRYLILALLVCIAWLQTGCASDSGNQDGPMDFPGQHNPKAIPDAKPRAETPSRYGNPNHYDVYGKRYYVKKSSKNFRQEGIASWYGKQFHGRNTSSGEPYDMFAMTAAHKTLPLPTYVRVTNQRNGKSIVVRVKDRGPFHSKRIIDLSYAAALKLGITNTGTAPVSIEAINSDTKADIKQATRQPQNISPQHKPTKSNRQSSKNIVKHRSIQLGVFADINNAKRLQNKILHSSIPAPEIIKININDAKLYRLVIGPLKTENEIQNVKHHLSQMGVKHHLFIAPTPP
jgi:rare lipoprotein A